MARPGRGHPRLRRPDPPARLLPRPGPRRRHPDRTHRDVLAPCGNRREAVCPACSDRYCRRRLPPAARRPRRRRHQGRPDHRHRHARAFVTLTAPSFGRVHTRTVTTPRARPSLRLRGPAPPRRPPGRHRRSTPTPTTTSGRCCGRPTPGSSGHRFVTPLRRALAAALGVRGPRLAASTGGCPSPRSPSTSAADWSTSTPSSASTAPMDPPTPRPAGLDHRRAPARRCATPPDSRRSHRPARRRHRSSSRWGSAARHAARPAAAARQLEDDAGEITDAALAGYIAKYATKGTGAHEGADRPIRDIAHIAHLRLTRPPPPHDQNRLAARRPTDYAELELRRWAHMLGFRGHFLTKSRRYSTTFRAIRTERRDPAAAGHLDRPTRHRRGRAPGRPRHRDRDQRLVARPLRTPRRRRTGAGRRHRRTTPRTTPHDHDHQEGRSMIRRNLRPLDVDPVSVRVPYDVRRPARAPDRRQVRDAGQRAVVDSS